MIHSENYFFSCENKAPQSYYFFLFIAAIINILVVSFLFLQGKVYAVTNLQYENIEYTYNNMWPLLLQPYYFYNPSAIASDEKHVYIADYFHHQIMKFKHSGQFVLKWGGNGNLQGQFNRPTAICYDRRESGQDIDYLYIADRLNYRIQVFSTSGVYIMEWPIHLDMDDFQFPVISGIAIDKTQRHYDYIYVSLFDKDIIQKYDENGNYISQWPDEEYTELQLDAPEGIVIDFKGNLYIADSKNHRIVKRNQNGDVEIIGSRGKKKGEFIYPACLTIDASGYLYVSDITNRIQKFDVNTSPVTQISEWGSHGTTKGKFQNITGLTINNDKIYVTDQYNNRVQQFSLEGQFICQWGQVNETGLNFRKPTNIFTDNSDNIYVADSENMRIVKFNDEVNTIQSFGREKIVHGIAINSKENIYATELYNHQVAIYNKDGGFISSWGQFGTKDGEFNEPHNIAIDSEDNVYVSDKSNHRIQKFSSDGTFILKWGEEGGREGQFDNPTGITIDDTNTIYVADSDNARVQLFSSNGNFIREFGQFGYETHHFQKPYDIALDDNGNIYVVDFQSDQIKIFNNQGEFFASIGRMGNCPGQLSNPKGICINNSGILYVADTMNNRIQSFKPEIKKDKTSKAIIIAGIQNENDVLAASTMSCAQFAYRTLTFRNISPDSISFFVGKNYSMIGDTCSSKIKYASISEINDAFNDALDADRLILFLVDHGGKNSFRLNENETLRFDFLYDWLKPFQGQLITIYDACYSGSFLNPFQQKKNWITITSSTDNEKAYFDSDGFISFSFLFWTHIFNGLSLKDSFILSQQSKHIINLKQQHPQFDDNGDGQYIDCEAAMIENECQSCDGCLAQNTYIGNGKTSYINDSFSIVVSENQTISETNQIKISARNIIGNEDNEIVQVKAIIFPPGFNSSYYYQPILELPSIDLTPSINTGFYEGDYSNIVDNGIYNILVYAKDSHGNIAVSNPSTISTGNLLEYKAIIIEGFSESKDKQLAFHQWAIQAYKALTGQLYSEKNITFFSSNNFQHDGTAEKPSISLVEETIQTVLSEPTYSLILYFVGEGNPDSFTLNSSENIHLADLYQWVEQIQDSIPGDLVIVYNVSNYQSFIEPHDRFDNLTLSPGQNNRSIIAYSDLLLPFSSIPGCDISFSFFFWKNILYGLNLYDAIHNVSKVMKYFDLENSCKYDANGDGINSDFQDESLMANMKIGFGIMLAEIRPNIQEISPEQNLYGETSIRLWAKNITATTPIDNVICILLPPSQNQNEHLMIELTKTNGQDKIYEGEVNGLLQKGQYDVIIYAKDDKGNLSYPLKTVVFQNVSTQGCDLDTNGDIDLTDLIIALKIVSNSYIANEQIDEKYHKIGLEELIHIIKIIGNNANENNSN